MHKQLIHTGITTAIFGALVLLIGSVAMASGLTVTNTFTSGALASAAEVNQNFTDAKTAVDDNDSRITALEAQIAALTGANITLASMTGTYTFVDLGASATGNLTNFTSNSAFSGKGDITFDGNGNFTFIDTQFFEFNQTVSATTNGFTSVQTIDITLENDSGTYTITPAGQLTVTFALDGSTGVAHMSPDLSMGSGNETLTESPLGGGTLREVELFVLIKQSP